MSIHKALILSSKVDACQQLASILKEKRIEATFASDMLHALRALQNQRFDLILCDMGHDQKEVADFVQKAKECLPKSHLLLLDLLSQTLKHSIDEACQKLKNTSPSMIATSPPMQRLLDDAAKIAASHANVFISGESGTGKELMAKFIHDNSPRQPSPFIKVNCAALPETLIESEFFGHEKGAFTGAINRRIGRFELADRGTLLLDEISEVPLSIQSKLLRAIQEGEFERLGGMHPLKVDVRLISTSNRIMEEMITKKEFREDLYYRLNVVPLTIPPLRDRAEDIIPLAEYFLEKACRKNHKTEKHLAECAKNRLLEHLWPGNIRELSNLIEHVVVLDKGSLILADHLPIKQKEILLANGEIPLGMTLAELESWYIGKVFESCGGNRTLAARRLGIHVRTLRNKLKF